MQFTVAESTVLKKPQLFPLESLDFNTEWETTTKCSTKEWIAKEVANKKLHDAMLLNWFKCSWQLGNVYKKLKYINFYLEILLLKVKISKGSSYKHDVAKLCTSVIRESKKLWHIQTAEDIELIQISIYWCGKILQRKTGKSHNTGMVWLYVEKMVWTYKWTLYIYI